jgi:DNA-binding transcriptional LysR family regulator
MDPVEPSLVALRAFLAVAEELHFGRAAEGLYTSVPTVSAHIKRLEQQLGFPVLQRSSRRVELTAQGKELVELARHVVAASDELSTWRNRIRRQELRPAAEDPRRS